MHTYVHIYVCSHSHTVSKGDCTSCVYITNINNCTNDINNYNLREHVRVCLACVCVCVCVRARVCVCVCVCVCVYM